MSRCLLIALLSLSLTQTLIAAPEEDIFNVDVSFGWDHYYRPMEWTPINFGIDSSLTEPFDGSIVISAQQDELNTMNIAYDFVLTPNMRQNMPLVTKLVYGTNVCNVTIYDKNRKRSVWRHEFDLWDFSTPGRYLVPVQETDLLVGVIGRRTFNIMNIAKETVCHSYQTNRQSYMGKVFIAEKTIPTVPWDWTGFSSLDLLVLYDPDWNSFRAPQLKAITQWVSNGGKLLCILGTHPLTPDNPISAIVPAEIGQAEQVTIDSSTLAQLNLNDIGTETISCWSLTPKSNTHIYSVQSIENNKCIFVAAESDFGRVGLLAFNPGDFSREQKDKASLFWADRFAAVLEDIAPSDIEVKISESNVQDRRNQIRRQQITSSLPIKRTIRYTENAEEVLGNPNINSRYYSLGGTHAASNAVMDFLYQGIRPLSIWWVILLLTALAVLLGPVDYIVLKRKDRLPLTWLTCTFWIVLFTVGAYYGVQALRAGDMELRVVSVRDSIKDSNSIWTTDYCGLFAPRSAEYKLKDLQENQWWSGIAPTRRNIGYITQTGSNRIYCRQRDGFNLPYSLPVNIWTIQCLMKESPAEDQLFDAKVTRQGDEVQVEITNLSNSPITGGYVLFNENRGRDFGSVPPKGVKEFKGPIRSIREWADESVLNYGQQYDVRRPDVTFDKESAYFAQGSFQRTEAIKRYLVNNAAVVCVEFAGAPLSYGVDSRLCGYNHIQLARLVVFPK